MASTFSAPFEGTNDVVITSANTTFTSTSGTATAKFSSAFAKAGTTSAKVQTASANCQLEVTRTSVTTAYWTFYLRPLQAPSVNTPVFFVGSSLLTTNRTFQVTLNADLTMKVQQGSASTIVGAITTSSLPLNQWSRVDVSLVSGALSFALFPGDVACDNAVGSALAGDKIAATIPGTAITALYIGAGSSGVNNLHFDAFREDDAVIPGPIASPDPDPVPGNDPAPKRIFYYDGTTWVGLA